MSFIFRYDVGRTLRRPEPLNTDPRRRSAALTGSGTGLKELGPAAHRGIGLPAAAVTTALATRRRPDKEAPYTSG